MARAESFLVFAGLVDVAHACVHAFAGPLLLAAQVEQLVPELVLAAVRQDEAIVWLALAFA
jgi:hypothetical protein